MFGWFKHNPERTADAERRRLTEIAPVIVAAYGELIPPRPG